MFPFTCRLMIIPSSLLLFLLMSLKLPFFQMGSNKSSRFDGLSPTFYKKFWGLWPWYFCYSHSLVWNGSFPPQINKTSIVLIPKIPNLTTMKDFRPISLYNVLYKIISKTLANRLKPLLQKCISLEQFAFIEGHSILEKVVIVSEILHHMISARLLTGSSGVTWCDSWLKWGLMKNGLDGPKLI